LDVVECFGYFVVGVFVYEDGLVVLVWEMIYYWDVGY